MTATFHAESVWLKESLSLAHHLNANYGRKICVTNCIFGDYLIEYTITLRENRY